MPENEHQKVHQIWEANQDLRDNKLAPAILVPLEERGGVNTPGPWENIVAIAFGRSLETFEAIQLLCSHEREGRFWNDGFILTRTHYETFLTLEWIALDPDTRSQVFGDELPLKMAHKLDLLGEKEAEVQAEKKMEIIEARDEVLKRHSRGPGTLQLMPKVKRIVDDLSDPLKGIYPRLLWEYEFYYRDVSGFTHPSGWGAALSISNPGEPVETVQARTEIGHKAMLCNGGWFFRILDRFNKVFEVVPHQTLSEWHREWDLKSGDL